MTGYLVTWRTSGGSRGHYLQWIPADQSFGFYAAEPRFATVFGLLEAEREAAVQRVLGRDAVVVHDVLQRPAPHVDGSPVSRSTTSCRQRKVRHECR